MSILCLLLVFNEFFWILSRPLLFVINYSEFVSFYSIFCAFNAFLLDFSLRVFIFVTNFAL